MSIIKSKLTNDWYKFTMPPVIEEHYPDTVVGYRFINRNRDFPLARYIDIDELKEELEAVRQLKFTAAEITYLRSLGIFSDKSLAGWAVEQLPKVEVERVGDQLEVRTQGLWQTAMAWESPALAIISELVSRALAKESGLSSSDTQRIGQTKLDEVIARLKDNPNVKFAQFGLRRHFSNDWERQVTTRLAEEVPDQMIGISNVELAKEFKFSLSGTIAHEYFIVPAALQIGRGTPNPLVVAQNEAMDNWEAEYGSKWNGGLLCAIPDTFGTDFFLKHFTANRAATWRTFKQDSGNPKQFVGKILARLTELEQDTSQFRINHTDGLTLDKMIELQAASDHQYRAGFGWGTTLTNNVGVPTNSLVWKPDWVLVDGVKVPCAKLSDNLNKATGDPAMIKRLKEEAGYKNTFCEMQTV